MHGRAARPAVASYTLDHALNYAHGHTLDQDQAHTLDQSHSHVVDQADGQDQADDAGDTLGQGTSTGRGGEK